MIYDNRGDTYKLYYDDNRGYMTNPFTIHILF